MYLLKTIPEDFIVREISNIQIKDSGKYLYFKLTKKNYNTLDAIKKIARALGLKEKQIGFAGTKDKTALTEQVCSLFGASKGKLLSLKIPDLSIQFLGSGDAPISLGDLTGNQFEITVRNLDTINIKPIQFIPNYFDEQRFGTSNVQIGRHLIKKQFADAVKLINDSLCRQHLQQKPNDYIGALKRLPIRLLRLYVNAYQSYLWNETLAQYLRTNGTVLKEEKYSQGVFVFTKEFFPELKISCLVLPHLLMP